MWVASFFVASPSVGSNISAALSVTPARTRPHHRIRQVCDDPCKRRCRGNAPREAATSGSSAVESAPPAKRRPLAHAANKELVSSKSQISAASVSSSSRPTFASIKESQALISRFHTVQKYLAAVDVDSTLSQQAREKRRRELKAELEALGGLPAYQQASLFGATAAESGAFNSGVWVHKELQDMRMLPPAEGRRLRLLDVGALQDHWSPHAHAVDATAIDLNPQHPSVLRADFFEFPPAGAQVFDALVLSLVLNFVGDPRRRGVMLERCAALLRPGGALFIVIPAACITNSRYMNHALFVRILHALGFQLSRHKITPKLALYALRRSECSEHGAAIAGLDIAELGCRRLCRTGNQRNNFAVLLGGEWGVAAEGNRCKLKPAAKPAAALKNSILENK